MIWVKIRPDSEQFLTIDVTDRIRLRRQFLNAGMIHSVENIPEKAAQMDHPGLEFFPVK